MITNFPKNNLSFSEILTRIFIILSLAVIIITSSFQLISNFNTQKELIYQKQTATALEISTEISRIIKQVTNTLETSVTVEKIIEKTYIDRHLFLQNLLNSQPAFGEIYLISSDGAELDKISRFETTTPINYKNSELFKTVSQNKNYTGPVYSKKTNQEFEPNIVFAVPIRTITGEFQGALAAEINLGFVGELTASLSKSQENLVYIVDKQGRIIAYDNQTQNFLLKDISNFGFIKNFVENKKIPNSNVESTINLQGQPVLSITAPLQDPNWLVIVESPRLKSYQPLIINLLLLVIITITIIIISIFVGAFLSRQITQPLSTLASVVNKISSENNFNIKVPTEGPIEISTLAHSFNTMVDKMKNYNQDLEIQIAKRTKDLKKSKRKLEEKINEIERINKLMVGRELKMIELKKEIAELKTKIIP